MSLYQLSTDLKRLSDFETLTANFIAIFENAAARTNSHQVAGDALKEVRGQRRREIDRLIAEDLREQLKTARLAVAKRLAAEPSP